MVTLRPPPGVTVDPDLRETLRAPPMDNFVIDDPQPVVHAQELEAEAPALELDYEPSEDAAPEVEAKATGTPTPLVPPPPSTWVQAQPSVDLLKLLDLNDDDFDLDDLAPPSEG